MRWGSGAVLGAAILVLGVVGTATAHGFGHHGGWAGGWGGGWWSGYTFVPYNEIVAQQYQDNRWLQAYGARQAWDAQQRTSDILVAQSLARNQTQAAQSYEPQLWWRDHVERQDALEFRAAQLRAAANPAGDESSPVIRWPSFLQQPQFAAARANLEAPFRRVQAGGRPVQPIEYRAMVDDIQRLKQQLEREGTNLEPHERAALQSFLDQMATEATAHATPPGPE